MGTEGRQKECLTLSVLHATLLILGPAPCGGGSPLSTIRSPQDRSVWVNVKSQSQTKYFCPSLPQPKAPLPSHHILSQD